MSLLTWWFYGAFVVITVSTIIWSLKRKDRVFQYPLLSGSVWLFYVGVQALGVMINPRMLPHGALADHGVEKALFVATCCVLCGFWGYIAKQTKVKVHNKKPHRLFVERRLWFGGILLILLAWASQLKLAGLSGGLLVHYSVEGSYTLNWSGLPVAFVFFTRLVYPGLAICLRRALKRPSFTAWSVVAAGAALPLANIVLLARRNEAVILVLVIALAYFFERGWVPKRSTVIAAMVIGSVMVIVVPSYRAHSQLGADSSKIWSIDVKETVISQIIDGDRSEFHYPVVQLAATDRAMEFNYGIGFYNRVVKEWVPSILVGRSFKEKLLLDAVDFRSHTLLYYGWAPQYGWIPTAIVDVFREFWYLGALLFYPLGRWMKNLWIRAIAGSAGSRIFYIAVAPLAMISVISGLTLMVSQLIYYLVFLGPIILLSRRKV